MHVSMGKVSLCVDMCVCVYVWVGEGGGHLLPGACVIAVA